MRLASTPLFEDVVLEMADAAVAISLPHQEALKALHGLSPFVQQRHLEMAQNVDRIGPLLQEKRGYACVFGKEHLTNETKKQL